MLYNNDDFRQNGYGDDINIDINNFSMNDNTNNNFNMNDMGNDTFAGSMEGPIVEPGKERVVQRNIVHEVKQYIPLLNNNFS